MSDVPCIPAVISFSYVQLTLSCVFFCDVFFFSHDFFFRVLVFFDFMFCLLVIKVSRYRTKPYLFKIEQTFDVVEIQNWLV